MISYETKPLQYFSGRRWEIPPFIPDNCKALLDIGCGCGAFGAFLKTIRDIEVWGVEPERKAATLALDALDKLVNGPFCESADLPNGYFDVITFLDSLEHFPDPYPPLELCKHKLKAGGMVVCSLPNVRYIENIKHLLIDMDWQYKDSGILDNTHLRFFTKKSMVRTFEIAGYDVLSISGINPYPSYWSDKVIFILRQFFRKWMEDMIFQQYVIVARPK